jgi:hypothetical protein
MDWLSCDAVCWGRGAVYIVPGPPFLQGQNGHCVKEKGKPASQPCVVYHHHISYIYTDSFVYIKKSVNLRASRAPPHGYMQSHYTQIVRVHYIQGNSSCMHACSDGLIGSYSMYISLSKRWPWSPWSSDRASPCHTCMHAWAGRCTCPDRRRWMCSAVRHWWWCCM